MSQLICPVCKQELNKHKHSFICSNHHTFDLAKEGYINLYHNQSLVSGDDTLMLNARKQILEKNYYQGVSQALNKLVETKIAAFKNRQVVILDCGCGEGYYLDALEQTLIQDNLDIYGFDISKKAVKMSSKRNKAITWFVANSNDIPMANHSVDCLLSMFTFYQPDEMKRVLKKDGFVLMFRAGENHLVELKDILYTELSLKTSSIEIESSGLYCVERLNHQSSVFIQNKNDVLHLLQMTPHYYKTTKENQAKLLHLESLEVTLDIDIYLIKHK